MQCILFGCLLHTRLKAGGSPTRALHSLFARQDLLAYAVLSLP